MTDETRVLAKFAANLAHDHIPKRIRARAVDLLVDQIGVEIGGSELPWAKQVRETYSKAGNKPAEATVIRYGDRLPVGSAAFINSAFGHSFEFDDANPLIHGHPGAELIPPLIAVAERDRVSGRDFLTAFIAAYEVRGRIGWAASVGTAPHHGPQYSTECGPFGVAAGVARLLGLSSEGIRNALGIAGSYSGGLLQYDHGGGSVKRIFTAVAASSGLQAAHLAQAGMTGPEGILEGTHGLLRLYASEYRPELLVAELGSKWTIENVQFKPYCCCAGIHPAIDGLKEILFNNNLKAHDIVSIDVGFPTRSIDHHAITSPHDLLGMQFSTSYSLALTALTGRNTPREYTLEALGNPEVRAVASRVRLHEDAELGKLFEGRYPARVKVQTQSQKVYEALVTNAKGSPGSPLSSAEIDDKFRSQVVDVLGAEQCGRLLHTLRHIDELDDLSKLAAMFVARNEKK